MQAAPKLRLQAVPHLLGTAQIMALLLLGLVSMVLITGSLHLQALVLKQLKQQLWFIQLQSNSHQSSNQNGAPRQISLNLSSTSEGSTEGHLLHGQIVDINVGGSQLTVNANTELTPAEKMAVMQVLRTGQQALLLDSQGSADGGTLTLGSRLSAHLSSLVIPKVSRSLMSRGPVL